MGKPLTEQQFKTITAQLRKKSNDIVTIAEASGLKVSTIKAIRRAETWQHYQAVRKAQAEQIKALHKLDKITKTSQTVQVQPMIHEIKPVARMTTQVELLERAVRDHTRIIAGLVEDVRILKQAVSGIQYDDIVDDIKRSRTFLARFRRGQR